MSNESKLTDAERAAKERLQRIADARATRPLYLDGDNLNEDCHLVLAVLDRLTSTDGGMMTNLTDAERAATIEANVARIRKLLGSLPSFLAARYNGPVYLTGSILHSPTPRDIDIRVVVPDYEFAARYGHVIRELPKPVVRGSVTTVSGVCWAEDGPTPRWVADIAKFTSTWSVRLCENVDLQVWPDSYWRESVYPAPVLLDAPQSRFFWYSAIVPDPSSPAAPAEQFDPSFNCPTHFAMGDPSCPACQSKQPKPTPDTAVLLEIQAFRQRLEDPGYVPEADKPALLWLAHQAVSEDRDTSKRASRILAMMVAKNDSIRRFTRGEAKVIAENLELAAALRAEQEKVARQLSEFAERSGDDLAYLRERVATFEELRERAKEYVETLGIDSVMVQNLPNFARRMAEIPDTK